MIQALFLMVSMAFAGLSYQGHEIVDFSTTNITNGSQTLIDTLAFPVQVVKGVNGCSQAVIAHINGSDDIILEASSSFNEQVRWASGATFALTSSATEVNNETTSCTYQGLLIKYFN